jgi:hypothetical protein
MNNTLTDQQARESLDTVEDITRKTQKSLAAQEGGLLLMVWGLILASCYLATEVSIRQNWISPGGIWILWVSVCGIGSCVTGIITWRQRRKGVPTRLPADKKLGRRYFWFWMLLFIYIGVWLAIIDPHSGIQSNAFILTAIMFAYVIMGIWSDIKYLLWLGLIVTALTLVGYFLIPHQYYNLWMAPAAGGPLFAVGLYIYLRWR